MQGRFSAFFARYCSVILTTGGFASAGTVYSVTEIPVAPGSTTVTVVGIDSAGRVVGFSDGAGGISDFLYTPGAGVTNITGSGPPAFGDDSAVTAINNHGQILLDSGLLYTPGGAAQNLAPALAAAYPNPPGLPETAADFTGLNDSGQVAGRVDFVNTVTGASASDIFLYTPGAGFTTVASAGTDRMFAGPQPFLVNDSGEVVYDTGDPPGSNASLWNAGTTVVFRCGSGNGWQSALNNAGEVAGNWSGGIEPSQPIVCSPGGSTDLIPAGSVYTGGNAWGLNNSGAVAGDVVTGNPFLGTQSAPVAALFADGGVTDLNTMLPPGSGWVLGEAQAINDAGWIAGEGTLNGVPEAFLLTPGGSVPEPSSWWLAAAAAALCLALRRV